MRIGIDGGCLANRRGFGRFARQAMHALSRSGSAHEFVVLVDRPSSDLVSVPANFETVIVDVKEAPSQAASAEGRRTVRDLLAMGRAASRAHLDLMYFPASYSFFPVWNVGKVVVTLHDTLALAHPELVFSNWKGRMAWAVKEHAAVRWANQIVTVSQAARSDLIAWFGLPPDRVSVVPEGPEDVFRPIAKDEACSTVLRKYGINPDRQFLLYVGGLSPHKNLPRLIEAFALAAQEDADLVLVGDTGDVFLTHIPALREAVDRFGIAPHVNFTGFVPDTDLAYLYNSAYALVHPSLMEGFGLPPVEAMACGTPVLSSNAGSLPEVVGDAGLFFDPTDVAAMAKTIKDLLNDPSKRDALAIKAMARSKLFTWPACASALLGVFDALDVSRATGRAA